MYKNFERNCAWNNGNLDYSKLPYIVLEGLKADKFVERTENCKIPSSSINEAAGTFDDHGSRKIQDREDPKVDEEKSICSNDPFQHKTTLHGVELQAKMFGSLTMQQLEF